MTETFECGISAGFENWEEIEGGVFRLLQDSGEFKKDDYVVALPTSMQQMTLDDLRTELCYFFQTRETIMENEFWIEKMIVAHEGKNYLLFSGSNDLGKIIGLKKQLDQYPLSDEQIEIQRGKIEEVISATPKTSREFKAWQETSGRTGMFLGVLEKEGFSVTRHYVELPHYFTGIKEVEKVVTILKRLLKEKGVAQKVRVGVLNCIDGKWYWGREIGSIPGTYGLPKILSDFTQQELADNSIFLEEQSNAGYYCGNYKGKNELFFHLKNLEKQYNNRKFKRQVAVQAKFFLQLTDSQSSEGQFHFIDGKWYMRILEVLSDESNKPPTNAIERLRKFFARLFMLP